ncbi:MAG TPA: hypothetical protein VNW94_17465 [Streptosporangiaceae bacterium]|nr:hypothetical protein [Streptosporangiaceae bacterium]
MEVREHRRSSLVVVGYGQVFDLRSGQCLDDPAQAAPSYPVRRTGNGAGDRMEVALP